MDKLKFKTFEEFVNESFHMPDGTPIGVDRNHQPIKVVKASKKVRDYGCVMLYLNVDEKAWKELQDSIDDSDVYDAEEGFGREDEPHVTILYGTHEDVEDSDIKTAMEGTKFTDPSIVLQSLSLFENEKYDVLKFDVSSKYLNKMNKVLLEFPHTTDYPDYHPHCTVAYLNPGAGKKYVQKLKEVIQSKPDKIVYSKTDGTKVNWPLNTKK